MSDRTKFIRFDKFGNKFIELLIEQLLANGQFICKISSEEYSLITKYKTITVVDINYDDLGDAKIELKKKFIICTLNKVSNNVFLQNNYNDCKVRIWI